MMDGTGISLIAAMLLMAGALPLPADSDTGVNGQYADYSAGRSMRAMTT